MEAFIAQHYLEGFGGRSSASANTDWQTPCLLSRGHCCDVIFKSSSFFITTAYMTVSSAQTTLSDYYHRHLHSVRVNGLGHNGAMSPKPWADSLQGDVRKDLLLVLVRMERCLHLRELVPLSEASGGASVMARYWSSPTKLSLSLTHTQSMTVDKSRPATPTIHLLILHHSLIIVPLTTLDQRNCHSDWCSPQKSPPRPVIAWLPIRCTTTLLR